MKNFSNRLLIFTSLLFCISIQKTSAQLVVDSIYDVPTMAYDFFDGTCVEVTNVTFQGSPLNMSFFEGSLSNIGLDMGILLTSGNVFDAVGPNDQSGTSTSLFLPGDPQLEALTQYLTYDAAILEMDIVPAVDTIFFDYVFASEEYAEFVGSGFNDVFGFFISGPGITGMQNIALVPGSDLPVTINNVNCNLTYSPHYVCNDAFNVYCDATYNCPGASDSSMVEYDGFTTPLKAYAVVIPDSLYHIKIGVADASDGIFDSGIFLGIGSLCGDGEKPAADFSYEAGGLNVAFESLAKYVRSYYWSFGDGTVSSEKNPDHQYTSAGIYEVMFVTTNYKGSDTIIKTIDLLGTGIANTLDELHLVVNPVTDQIAFSNSGNQSVSFYLYHPLGHLVKTGVYSGNFSVNVSDLATGTYFVHLVAGNRTSHFRVVKQ